LNYQTSYTPPSWDKMLEELDKLAAPFRAVPAEVWARYGGPPDFLGSFGHTTT
jgi:hypothetical protein